METGIKMALYLVLVVLHQILEVDHQLLQQRRPRRLQLVLQRDDDGHHVLYHVLLHHLATEETTVRRYLVSRADSLPAKARNNKPSLDKLALDWNQLNYDYSMPLLTALLPYCPYKHHQPPIASNGMLFTKHIDIPSKKSNRC